MFRLMFWKKGISLSHILMSPMFGSSNNIQPKITTKLDNIKENQKQNSKVLANEILVRANSQANKTPSGKFKTWFTKAILKIFQKNIPIPKSVNASFQTYKP